MMVCYTVTKQHVAKLMEESVAIGIVANFWIIHNDFQLFCKRKKKPISKKKIRDFGNWVMR